MSRLLKVLFYLCSISGSGLENGLLFEGSWRYVFPKIEDTCNPSHFFLPYNPIIVVAGGYSEGKIQKLAHHYPKGQIYVFEPNPEKFPSLKKETEHLFNTSVYHLAFNTYNGFCPLYIYHRFPSLLTVEESSLLPPLARDCPYFQKKIKVPCIRFEDWCQQIGLSSIDCLQLHLGGFELEFLKSIPTLLKTVLVIHLKTEFSSWKKNAAKYEELKRFLETSEFKLLSHWYFENSEGEATFIQRKMHEAMFDLGL